MEETVSEEQPSVEALQAQLAEVRAELDQYKNHLHRANTESAERRIKLKEIQQNSADREAAIEKYQAQLAKQTEELEQARKVAKTSIKAAQIERAIAEHRGIPELLRPMLEQTAEVTAEGVFVEGKPIKEYLGELRESEVFGNAFLGRGMSGGGFVGKTSQGAAKPPSKPRSQMSNSEKTQFIHSFGIEEYNRLAL